MAETVTTQKLFQETVSTKDLFKRPTKTVSTRELMGKPIGFVEGITEDALFKIPVTGPALEGMELARLKLASNRLNTPAFDWGKEAQKRKQALDWEYGKPRFVQTMSRGEYLKKRKGITAESAKQADIGGIEGYIKAMAEREERGYSIPGRIGQGISILPGWMFEFALTGGLYRSGSAPVKRFLQNQAKSRLLARTGGWLAGSAVRTTVGMPQRVFANTMRRSLEENEGWATAIAKGWVETFIEAASEEAGQTITKGGMGIIKRLPFGNKFLGSLQKSWSKLSPNNTAAKFAKKMLTKGGYSNLIGEIGEERLATIMHGLAGTVGTEGDPIERVLAGLEQDIKVKNMLTEAAVLSVPGAVRLGAAQLGRFGRTEEDIRQEADIADMDAQAQRHLKSIREEAKTPSTVGIPEPQKAIQPRTPEEGVELPPEAEIGRPEPPAETGKVETFIHETDAEFDTFDLEKAGTGQGEQWYGKGIYLTRKGGFKLEQYGKRKIEATLKPNAKIFEGDIVEYAKEKGLADSIIEWRTEEELSLDNITPRDVFKANVIATKKGFKNRVVEALKADGYDGLLVGDELVVYNPAALQPAPKAEKVVPPETESDYMVVTGKAPTLQNIEKKWGKSSKVAQTARELRNLGDTRELQRSKQYDYFKAYIYKQLEHNFGVGTKKNWSSSRILREMEDLIPQFLNDGYIRAMRDLAYDSGASTVDFHTGKGEFEGLIKPAESLLLGKEGTARTVFRDWMNKEIKSPGQIPEVEIESGLWVPIEVSDVLEHIPEKITSLPARRGEMAGEFGTITKKKRPITGTEERTILMSRALETAVSNRLNRGKSVFGKPIDPENYLTKDQIERFSQLQKEANTKGIVPWAYVVNKMPEAEEGLKKAWLHSANEMHSYLMDRWRSGEQDKPQRGVWPTWEKAKARWRRMGIKPQLRVEGKVPETDKADIIIMESSPFYSNRVVIAYPSKRQIQVGELPLTESDAKANLGDKLYDRAKEKGFSLAPAERVVAAEGRIRIETYPDGLNRGGTLAHARGHIGLRYVREASPKLFKKIQTWYDQRLKAGRSTRPMDEMFARAYVQETQGLRSNLPRDVVNAINSLNLRDVSDEIFQRIISNWNSPDYSVTKKPELPFAEPPRPEGPNVLMLTEVEKRLDEKAMLSEKRKLRPGARRLAKQFIGKTDLRKMTEEELSKFGQIISRLPEPTYNNKGQRIPPSIPKTTAVTEAGEFEKEYTEPTFMRIFHAPEYYAEKLGVKSLVEKAEAGKITFSLEYQQLSNKVDKWIKLIEKLGKTSTAEKARAKLRNLPTKAVARFRELLDTHDEPPDTLNKNEKELFNNFRDLTRWLLKRENAVRESLELKPIQYRKAYVRHVANGMAKEMMEGRYPFPQGRKFWAEEIIAKKIFNPMEMHRTLTEDLEEIFSRDLGFATKSMLWTALKEIHLSQPIRYLEQQLTAKGKDTPVYKVLSPSEQAKWDKVATIPSRTRRWVKDYVNTTIKGQQSWLDQDIEAIVKKTGLNGLLNRFLRPFGRTLSYKPVSSFFTKMGRAQIMGVLGGPIGGRPRQIIRNKFQTLQNMALYPLYKETWRTYAPIRALRNTTPDLERLLDKSLFLKAYTGTEEWPVDIKSKIAKGSLAAFQWSAVTNARQAMECAYWGMQPLFNDPKFKDYGWSDPERIKIAGFKNKEELLLKEMEFGASATQHNYTAIGMPGIFRHKTLTPLTRLQSWWMNHYFRFTEEALRRAFTGRPTYIPEGGPTLPWKYRLGWLRYALIAVPILNMMRYQRSYLFGAAPTGMPPFAQFAQGMYNYVVGKGAGNDRQWKRGKKQMIQSGKTFIPGYMAYKDWEAIWTGRKELSSLFFYKKR